MNNELAGKVAIVTGASSGIGAATVTALLEGGAFVVAVARRVDRLKELAAHSSHSSNCLILEGDITQRQMAATIVEKATAWKGRLDILVNNAGVSSGTVHELSSEDDFEHMLDTNVLALLSLTRAATKALKLSQGVVINISSTAVKAMLPGGAVYSASKAAVAAFSESFRKEMAPNNVRVVVVYPGYVETELFDRFDPAKKAEFKQRLAGIDPLSPEDLARVIVFAIAQPAHVALNEIVVRPTKQIP